MYENLQVIFISLNRIILRLKSLPSGQSFVHTHSYLLNLLIYFINKLIFINLVKELHDAVCRTQCLTTDKFRFYSKLSLTKYVMPSCLTI